MAQRGQVKMGLGRTFSLVMVSCAKWGNAGDPGGGGGLLILPALQMSSGHFSL